MAAPSSDSARCAICPRFTPPPIFSFCRLFTIRFPMPVSKRSLPGCRSITTRDNGFSEIIEQRVHGSIVDAPSNIAQICEALRLLGGCRIAERPRAQPFSNAPDTSTSQSTSRRTLAVLTSRCQSGRRVGKNPEDLIEPRDLENRPHAFLQAAEGKFSAITADVLHRLDQDREPGAVDVADLAKDRPPVAPASSRSGSQATRRSAAKRAGRFRLREAGCSVQFLPSQVAKHVTLARFRQFPTRCSCSIFLIDTGMSTITSSYHPRSVITASTSEKSSTIRSG